LVTGTAKVAVPVVLATVAEVDPWLEAKADDAAAPAISLVMEAARVCHGHAHQAAVGDGPGLHQRLQRLAGELVAATAAAPKLSRKVWNAPTRRPRRWARAKRRPGRRWSGLRSGSLWSASWPAWSA
jgi:hypothetical protein